MKIGVAMSGGLDSAITALLLQEQGHEIIGITANFLPAKFGNFDNAIADAQKLAQQFNFPHHIVDLSSDFEKEVIQPFCQTYLRGETPSPCILCNAKLKFKRLLETAKSLGCDKLATGHYAQICQMPNGRLAIKRGVDEDKDQAYFLFMLEQKILKDVLFPLGQYKKQKIKAMGQELNLAIAQKEESQEICFIADDDYKSFIEKNTISPLASGNIVNTEGKILGKHLGIHRYTIGQRRGLGIAADRPLYVIDIDAQKNCIIVGYKEFLERHGLITKDCYLMGAKSLDNVKCYIKMRSTQKPQPVTVTKNNEGLRVIFDKPQMEVSKGQAAVFYDQTGAILGGGWIAESF